jgi:hypothetical protein
MRAEAADDLRRLMTEALYDSATSDIYAPRRWKTELASSGIDEMLQGIGGDPFRSLDAVGLRIPGLANDPTNRYLFQLVTIPVPRGTRVRVLGYRQLLTLGVLQPSGEQGGSRLVELVVRTPTFRLPDGNVSWHMTKVTGKPPIENRLTNSDNFLFRYGRTGSQLVYETAHFPAANVDPFGRPDFYVTLDAYTPPNGGMPFGTPIMETVHDIRNPWDEPHSEDWLVKEVDGPGTIVMWASVRQTALGGSPRIIQTPNPNNLQILGPDEEKFIAQYPGQVKLWRVAGAVLYEVIS